MKFVHNDGGRSLHFKGSAGDCVTRAIAIAAELPYDQVYAAMAHGNGTQRRSKRERAKGAKTARNGILVKRKWFKDYMASIGFVWTPTMQIGSGCKVHLHDGELPMGRLVVSVSKHYTAVIDGVINDTHDPQREDITHWYTGGAPRVTISRRCVYGYWSLT
jgi:hypothetical protein